MMRIVYFQQFWLTPLLSSLSCTHNKWLLLIILKIIGIICTFSIRFFRFVDLHMNRFARNTCKENQFMHKKITKQLNSNRLKRGQKWIVNQVFLSSTGRAKKTSPRYIVTCMKIQRTTIAHIYVVDCWVLTMSTQQSLENFSASRCFCVFF